MCEPITLGIAGLAAGAIGSAMQADGQRAQASAEAQALEEAARLSEAAGADALQRGETEAGRYRAEGSRVVAAQRVAAGASGVDVGSASITASLMDTRMVSELDAQTARVNGAREAWGYKVQGDTQRKQARLTLQRGEAAAGATLLGGALNAGVGAGTLALRTRGLYPKKGG